MRNENTDKNCKQGTFFTKLIVSTFLLIKHLKNFCIIFIKSIFTFNLKKYWNINNFLCFHAQYNYIPSNFLSRHKWKFCTQRMKSSLVWFCIWKIESLSNFCWKVLLNDKASHRVLWHHQQCQWHHHFLLTSSDHMCYMLIYCFFHSVL